MIKYYTAFDEASVEQTVDRSRFIGHVKPIYTKEEAESFIIDIRKKYRDATHNVPALVLGAKMEVQWASDDGEPQGTSGAPIVQMLVNKNITNIVMVITRYFGGIKLGTGGLVRAYTGTAKLVLDKAGISAVREMRKMLLSFDYTFLGKIENLSYGGDFSIQNTEYLDKVNATIIVDTEKRDVIYKKLINITSGTAKIVSENTVEKKVKISV